jgi:hypothetical protein
MKRPDPEGGRMCRFVTYDHLRGRFAGNIDYYKHTTAFGVEEQNRYFIILNPIAIGCQLSIN